MPFNVFKESYKAPRCRANPVPMTLKVNDRGNVYATPLSENEKAMTLDEVRVLANIKR